MPRKCWTEESTPCDLNRVYEWFVNDCIGWTARQCACRFNDKGALEALNAQVLEGGELADAALQAGQAREAHMQLPQLV